MTQQMETLVIMLKSYAEHVGLDFHYVTNRHKHGWLMEVDLVNARAALRCRRVIDSCTLECSNLYAVFDTITKDIDANLNMRVTGPDLLVARYAKKDIENTKIMRDKLQHTIQNVVFNDPATIVFWSDGTKTVVKCTENDIYDPMVGLSMAISKKVLGDNYKKTFKKWVPKSESREVEIDELHEVRNSHSHLCDICKYCKTNPSDDPCWSCIYGLCGGPCNRYEVKEGTTNV